MDNKKNTILLTVIAVATLLVAVVGATFAYFIAQEGEGANTNITVKTGTGSSSAFTATQNLNVYADQSTFAEGKTSKTGTSTGKVTWTAPGSTDAYTPTETERTFCYTVKLDIKSNNFRYDLAGSTSGTAQLLFNVFRGVGETDGSTGYEAEITEGVAGLTYITSASNSVKGVSPDIENSYVTFGGWDITTATGEHQIGGEYKMVASETTGGDPVTTMYDTWTATVTLVNLKAEQNYNTNKTFTATLKYDQC